jgi:hypothetical protein
LSQPAAFDALDHWHHLDRNQWRSFFLAQRYRFSLSALKPGLIASIDKTRKAKNLGIDGNSLGNIDDGIGFEGKGSGSDFRVERILNQSSTG